ncbi:MAG: hypothetical protein JRH20_28300, partial [Deltaproteobacteria bacterium]|nr:hypothetical protein [Deltaproteobacteria bacterium]
DSGEACIFSPHIGAYQGGGALRGPCVFSDGIGANAIRGVTLYGY